MSAFDNLAPLSPLPIVDLRSIAEPTGGWLIKVTRTCQKNFKKNDKCLLHYRSLARSPLNISEPIQCPYGFSSSIIDIGDLKVAVTGVVPYPRLGGSNERARALDHPEVKITRDSLRSTIQSLSRIYEGLRSLQSQIINNQSMALHEIRKLNRTVKQTAERLYEKYKTDDLLSILKSAELMSKQFDIIEILANESIANLPRKTTAEVYKLIDKCVHIYQPTPERIRIYCATGYYPKILVSDKTFPIIPTVLIENALKYSLPGSEIKISIEQMGDHCTIKFTNLMSNENKLDESIFLRGVRASTDEGGSGNGLYVAQLVARQHGAKICLEQVPVGTGQTRCTFSIGFKVLET